MNPAKKTQGKPILEFHLFSSPTMVYQTRPFTLPRRQARALLFRLAATNSPVPREELADLIWSNKSPAVARRNLTRLLSYLRGQLPHSDLLQVSRTAVALNPNLTLSDVVQFMQLCASVDASDWETSVSLYQGPFLATFALNGSHEFDNWVSREQRRLEQHYLETLRRLITHPAMATEKAIHFAKMYLEADDLAEDIHRQLLTLYAANDNRSSALRQYEQCVVVLERELGVPPLPETRTVYEAVRDGRPLTPPQEPSKPEWATLPGLDLPLIGRDEDWKAIEAAYARFRSGGAIFIAGEPGVGKSRLMQDFAEAQPSLILTGNNPTGSQRVPYESLVQALRQALPLQDRWRHAQPIWLAEAARLLPELTVQFPGLPAAVAVEPAQAQARLFEALTRLFRSLSTDSPLLLCLDDVHSTDEATLGWLHYVTKQLKGSQICIIATYRTHEAGLLRGWRRVLGRANLMVDVVLDGLSETAVADLLSQVDDDVIKPTQLAPRIHAATGGNAFFVLETIRELLETNQLTNPPAELPLPATVRETILRRAGRLSPLAQQVLEITAVLTPHATLETIAETAGRDGLETAVSLEKLTARQLLKSEDDGFHFHHDLGREAIYQAISSWRQQLLHRRAGDTLGKLYAHRPETIAAQRAGHYEVAKAYVQAVDFYKVAAIFARKQYAPEEAIAYLQRALELVLNDPVNANISIQLHESLADIFHNIGQMEKAVTSYREAIIHVSQDDFLQLARLKKKLASSLSPLKLFTQAVTLYQEALEHLDGNLSEKDQWESDRLNIMLLLSDTLFHQQKIESMRGVMENAIPLLERVGTSVQYSKFYIRENQLALYQNRWQPTEKNIGLAALALSYAQKAKSPWLIGNCKFILGYTLLWYGDYNAAAKVLMEALTFAKNRNNHWLQVQCLSYFSILHRLSDKLKESRNHLRSLMSNTQLTQYPDFNGIALANTAWLHYRSGKWSHAQSHAERALRKWDDMLFPFKWTALMILLVLALRQNQLLEAIDFAHAMLDIKQQRLPDIINVELMAADTAWKANDVDHARKALETAVSLATQHGYL